MDNSAKQTVSPGKYVEMGYDLYKVEDDGSARLVHQTSADDPESIVFGVTPGVIGPLEKAIEGLAPGDSFTAEATADEAFGQPDPEKIVTLERDIFLVDGKFDNERIYPGAAVPMMTADGFRLTGVVKAVTQTDVTLDFNHPLAGKNVRFAGKILVVRDATPEELKPVQGCAGCHGCGDGCGDGGGCHGGCGC